MVFVPYCIGINQREKKMKEIMRSTAAQRMHGSSREIMIMARAKKVYTSRYHDTVHDEYCTVAAGTGQVAGELAELRVHSRRRRRELEVRQVLGRGGGDGAEEPVLRRVGDGEGRGGDGRLAAARLVVEHRTRGVAQNTRDVALAEVLPMILTAAGK